MSGLSLVCDYGDSEESDNEDTNKLKKSKLPTPNLSKVSVVKSEDYFDDPLLHGGRVRVFPHVRGNWATFVYIQYPDSDDLNKVIDTFVNVLVSSGISCQKSHNIHISLSKTFVLNYHLITPLTNLFHSVITSSESLELGFTSVAVYCNEEKTRTFIALKVDTITNRELSKLTEKIYNVLVDFKLPTFYKDPSFHMSILDIVGNKKAEVSEVLDNLNNIFIKEEKNIGTHINKHFSQPSHNVTLQNNARKIFVNPNFIPSNKYNYPHECENIIGHQNFHSSQKHYHVNSLTQKYIHMESNSIFNSQTDGDWCNRSKSNNIQNYPMIGTKNHCNNPPIVKSRYSLIRNNNVAIIPLNREISPEINQIQNKEKPQSLLENRVKHKTISQYCTMRNIDKKPVNCLANNITIKVNRYKTTTITNLRKEIQTVKASSKNKTIYPQMKAKIQKETISDLNISKPLLNANKYRFRKIDVTRKKLKTVFKYTKLNSTLKRNVQFKLIRDKVNNIPCRLFVKYGKCLRKSNGRCEFVHNKKHVSLCRKFLKGICHDSNCLLSHELTAKKMPTCYFYLKGMCIKENCPYLHVKLSSKSKLCKDFLRGYCEKGENCLEQHVRQGCVFKVKRNMRERLTKVSLKEESRNSSNQKIKKKDLDVIPQQSVSDTQQRYYKDAVDENETFESIKPLRCKLGNLPSYINIL